MLKTDDWWDLGPKAHTLLTQFQELAARGT